MSHCEDGKAKITNLFNFRLLLITLLCLSRIGHELENKKLQLFFFEEKIGKAINGQPWKRDWILLLFSFFVILSVKFDKTIFLSLFDPILVINRLCLALNFTSFFLCIFLECDKIITNLFKHTELLSFLHILIHFKGGSVFFDGFYGAN